MFKQIDFIMRIAEDIVQRVKEQVDILDIIGEFVRLKKASGGRYVGLCPFHEDKKTPSFSVTPAMGVYHCFGCKKSGNSFTFLKDYLGLTFSESIEYVAKKYNINVSYSEEVKQKETKNERAYKAMAAAADFFALQLKTKDGLKALEYFNNRDFDADTIKKFLLGFSPNSFENTRAALNKLGFADDVLLDAGLIIENEDGKRYDRFRGRAMFPIKDFIGRVIGFGARLISDEVNQPKYINSPQTIIYDKSKVLYGLFEAKNAIRNANFALVSEGYADLISLHNAGFVNSVASSGTAFTVEQLNLLARYTNTLFLVFDSDDAGEKATERSIELAIEQGFDVKIVSLPIGEDPDSIIRNFGKKVFEQRVKEASGFLDYLVALLLKRNGNSPVSKANIARYMLNLIAKVKDRLQHDFYLSSLANLLDLTENQLRIIYSEKKKIEHKESEEPPIDLIPNDYSFEKEYNELDNFDAIAESNDAILLNINELLPEEKIILQSALMLPKYFSYILECNVSEATFTSETGKLLFSILLEYSDELNIIQTMMEIDDIPPEITQAMINLLIDGDKPSDNWINYDATFKESDRKTMINDALKSLEIKVIDSEIDEVKKRISSASDEYIDSLCKRLSELAAIKNILYSEFNK